MKKLPFEIGVFIGIVLFFPIILIVSFINLIYEGVIQKWKKKQNERRKGNVWR